MDCLQLANEVLEFCVLYSAQVKDGNTNVVRAGVVEDNMEQHRNSEQQEEQP